MVNSILVSLLKIFPNCKGSLVSDAIANFPKILSLHLPAKKPDNRSKRTMCAMINMCAVAKIAQTRAAHTHLGLLQTQQAIQISKKENSRSASKSESSCHHIRFHSHRCLHRHILANRPNFNGPLSSVTTIDGVHFQEWKRSYNQEHTVQARVAVLEAAIVRVMKARSRIACVVKGELLSG